MEGVLAPRRNAAKQQEHSGLLIIDNTKGSTGASATICSKISCTELAFSNKGFGRRSLWGLGCNLTIFKVLKHPFTVLLARQHYVRGLFPFR